MFAHLLPGCCSVAGIEMAGWWAWPFVWCVRRHRDCSQIITLLGIVMNSLKFWYFWLALKLTVTLIVACFTENLIAVYRFVASHQPPWILMK